MYGDPQNLINEKARYFQYVCTKVVTVNQTLICIGTNQRVAKASSRSKTSLVKRQPRRSICVYCSKEFFNLQNVKRHIRSTCPNLVYYPWDISFMVTWDVYPTPIGLMQFLNRGSLLVIFLHRSLTLVLEYFRSNCILILLWAILRFTAAKVEIEPY